MKKKKSGIYPKNSFLKKIITLISGTGIGQLISIISLPLLTRIYDPQSFSILAIYISILSLLTVICCLRFEIAIPLPKSEKTAAALYILSTGSVLFFSALSLFIIIIFEKQIHQLSNGKLQDILYLIPISILSIGLYNSLQYWNTRKQRFKLISKTKISQSLIGSIIKLFVGYFITTSSIGLTLGQLVSQGSGFLSLGLSALKNDLNTFKKINRKHIKIAFKKYINFPKYSVLEGFSNTGSIQIPILIISYYIGGNEIGFLLVATQLMSAPMTLIGSSVSQVYLADGANLYHQNKLNEFTKKTIKNLIKISIAPIILIAFSAPYITSLALGETWIRTGLLISWMTPWFFMQFITSPISMSLHIMGHQKTAFYLQIFGLALRVSMVFIAANYFEKYISEIYAISGFIFYSIYLLIILKKLK